RAATGAPKIRLDGGWRGLVALAQGASGSGSGMPRSEVAAVSERRGTATLGVRRRVVAILAVLAGLAAVLFFFSRAGVFLILQAREGSEVMVVLNGAGPQAVKLQKEGSAPEVLLDASVNHTVFGRNEADFASEFLASAKPAGMQLCRVKGDST